MPVNRLFQPVVVVVILITFKMKMVRHFSERKKVHRYTEESLRTKLYTQHSMILNEELDHRQFPIMII